jgi:hypothetical protein
VDEYRLETLLKALMERGEALISSRLTEEQRLSRSMREKCERVGSPVGSHTPSFAFDAIYWQELDERVFGPGGTAKDAWEKMKLLDEEQSDMEDLIQRKMKEMKDECLRGGQMKSL